MFGSHIAHAIAGETLNYDNTSGTSGDGCLRLQQQFQGPAMAATGEQSCCLKLTSVSVDLRTVRLEISAETEAHKL